MKYMVFYKGPATPPGASHEGWMRWFSNLGESLVDQGSPITNGIVMNSDGSTTDSATNFNGYSVIRAENRKGALDLVKDHPYLRLGHGYTIELFERGS